MSLSSLLSASSDVLRSTTSSLRLQIINIGIETPFLPFSVLSHPGIVAPKIAVSLIIMIVNWCMAFYFITQVLDIVPEPEDSTLTLASKTSSLESSRTVSRAGSLSKSKSQPPPANLMEKQTRFYNRMTDWCSLVCVVSHAMWPTFLFFQTSGWIKTPLACSLLTRSEYYVIGLARTSFYCVLALRTRASFLNTVFELTVGKFIGIVVVAVTVMQSQTIWSMVVQPTVLLEAKAMNMQVCVVVWDILVVIVYGISDVGITFWFMYLFGKKLAETLTHTSRGQTMDPRLLGFLRKWLLLGWISILGTWFLQCFGLFMSLMEISGSLDSLLNMICVIAVYREANGLYIRCCNPIEDLVYGSRCACCCASSSKLLALELANLTKDSNKGDESDHANHSPGGRGRSPQSDDRDEEIRVDVAE